MEQMTGTAPEHICTLLLQGCTGFVEMVNSRGIYLQTGCRHILLCHSQYGTVPNGVSLTQWERLPAILASGQPIRVEEGVLYAPAVTLALQLHSVPKNTQILFPEKKSLGAGIEQLLANVKNTGLSMLAYPLLAGQAVAGNLYCDTALPHVKTLLLALQEKNTADIQRSVCNLLGLGPGLTPSGDDLLSGLVYGLRHGPARNTVACGALCDAIRENAPERTNAVSADYLIALVNDAPFDLMAAAWEDSAGGAARLMQLGHNSGGEMLLGLLCAGMLQAR